MVVVLFTVAFVGLTFSALVLLFVAARG